MDRSWKQCCVGKKKTIEWYGFIIYLCKKIISFSKTDVWNVKQQNMLFGNKHFYSKRIKMWARKVELSG